MYGLNSPATAPKGGLLPPVASKVTNCVHVAIFIVGLSLAFAGFDNSLFSWHPLLMSFGFIILMGEGLVAAVSFRTLDGAERVTAIQSHALIQLRAVACILAGFAVIFRNKILNEKLHFQSLHSQMGLATVVLTVAAPFLGMISFRRLGFIQKFPERWQPRIKWLHRQMGTFVWTLSLIVIELGIRQPSVNKGLLTVGWQVGVAIVWVLMMMMMRVSQPKLKTYDGMVGERALGKAV